MRVWTSLFLSPVLKWHPAIKAAFQVLMKEPFDEHAHSSVLTSTFVIWLCHHALFQRDKSEGRDDVSMHGIWEKTMFLLLFVNIKWFSIIITIYKQPYVPPISHIEHQSIFIQPLRFSGVCCLPTWVISHVQYVGNIPTENTASWPVCGISQHVNGRLAYLTNTLHHQH